MSEIKDQLKVVSIGNQEFDIISSGTTIDAGPYSTTITTNIDVQPKGGTKHDSGKPDISLLPRAFMEGTARAFMFGAQKYGRDNYKAGFELTRPLAAAQRHILAFLDGEDKDPESGLSHLDHAAASLAMCMETLRLGTAIDNRYKGPQTLQETKNK